MLVEFCLPVLNEEKILEKNSLELLEFCQKENFPFAWKIVFIVNGSTDRSLEICRKLENSFPEKIKVFVENERGKGRAIKRCWSNSEADVLAFMDTDLPTSLENIRDLILPFLEGKFDLVIGSRLLPGAKISRPINREFVSQTYNLLSRLVLGHRFSDMQCGFKAIRRDSFMKIAPFVINNKWFFDTELIALSEFMKLRIKEIPVVWEERRYEQSKSKINILKDSLFFLASLFALRVRIGKLKRENKRGLPCQKQ